MARVGRPKKTTNKLPEWFKIENYSRTKAFSTYDWYINLTARKNLIDWFLFLEGKIQDQHAMGEVSEKDAREDLNKVLAFVRRFPCLNFDEIETKDYAFYSIAGEELCYYCGIPLDDDTTTASYGVHEARPIDVFWAFRHLPDAKRYLDVFGLAEAKETDNLNLDAITQYDEIPWSEKGTGLFSINLTIPDDVLISDFKLLLKKLRKKPRYSPFLKSVNLDRWSEIGLLPYLDLKIWEKVCGESFNFSHFASLLAYYSPNLPGESGLRKALEDTAPKAISNASIAMLCSQAAKEYNGEVRKSGKFLTR